MERIDGGVKPAAVVVPSSCPACSSTDLSTTSKTPDEATYWRCRTCGEVWNASRRKVVERLPFRR